MADLQKDQLSIFDMLEPEEPKSPAEIWAEETGFSDYWQHDTEFINDKPVCTYSKHSCNRKELWKIADTMDGISCIKQCCRKCDVQYCGVRCNGSEDPNNNKKRIPEECIKCEYIGKSYDIYGNEETDFYHCGLDGHPTWNEKGIPGKKCKKNLKKKSLEWSEFKEHCRHNGWTRGATETEPAAVMCSFNNRQNAKCWDDWIECNIDNCPLLK